MRSSIAALNFVLENKKVRSIIGRVPFVILFGVSLCRTVAQTPNGPEQKAEKEFHSASDRLKALQNASIFSADPVSDADIVKGPAQPKDKFHLHFNDKVICDFVTPGSQMGGKTEKFACQITRVESPDGEVQILTGKIKEEPVKVKYGSGDNEVFAEVAATRLMWALGFYADGWFPVRVECHNCPANPEAGSGAKDTRMFDPAIIVRKFPGHKMYEAGKEDEGWSWKELAQVNQRPTYERDGLALLAAFLVHSDNKAQQQRLVCGKVKVDESTQPFTTTCDESRMLVQDVGATFGGGGLFTNNDSAKMNLEKWSGNGLWKKVGKSESDCQECQARLRNSLTGKDGLEDPMISEEGRRFLAGLMCQLSDAQIGDLFRVARVARMPRYHNADGSFKSKLSEDAIVQEWVEAFKKKREELASGRCQWKNKPADLKTVDNPDGLAAVPNYCAAHPF